MGFLSHVTNLKELKTEYKRLVHIYHPDCGGDNRTMQEINEEYSELLKMFSHINSGEKSKYQHSGNEYTSQTKSSTDDNDFNQCNSSTSDASSSTTTQQSNPETEKTTTSTPESEGDTSSTESKHTAVRTSKSKAFSRSTVLCIIFSVLFLVSLVVNMYFLMRTSKLNIEISKASETIDTLEKQKAFIKEQGKQIEEANNDLNWQINFYKDRTVLLPKYNPVYFHNLNCKDISFYQCIVSSSPPLASIESGYHPCPSCHGSLSYIVLDIQAKMFHCLDCRYLPSLEDRSYIGYIDYLKLKNSKYHDYAKCPYCLN